MAKVRKGRSGKPPCSALINKLDNIVVIVDYNSIQLDGFVKDILDLSPLADKWRSFGWHTIEINGHDIPALQAAFAEAAATKGKPTAIVAHTVKGKGVSFMENNPKIPRDRAHPGRSAAGASGATVMQTKMKFDLKLGMATREAFGKTLAKLGAENPKIVVCDADLSKSTYTSLFAKEFPDRFFECGIAEANMVSIGAGLASSGKIPFVSSFSCFVMNKGFEQLRVNVAYPRLNVKIVGTHSGISIGEDGPFADEYRGSQPGLFASRLHRDLSRR